MYLEGMLKTNNIYQLVKTFREAIDKAYEDDRFKRYPFNRFPKECCSHVSDLLYYYLLKMV